MIGMDTNKGAPAGAQNKGQNHSLFEQPRKAASGIVYSGAVAAMLIFSLVYAVTLALVAQALGMTTAQLQQIDVCRYISYLVSDAAFLAVIAAFVKIYKEGPKQFGFCAFRPRYAVLALLLAFGTLFSLNWVNTGLAALLERFGYTAPASDLPSLEGAGFFGVLLVVALLPAFFEETLLRGIVLSGIKDCGTVAVCLLSGLLFAVLHMNPVQTVYQFICGCLFALIAVRSGSVIPSMIAHFANNAVILLDAKFLFFTNLSGAPLYILCALSAAALLAVLAWLAFFDKSNARKKEGAVKPFLVPAAVGLAVGALVWAVNLASGFGG